MLKRFSLQHEASNFGPDNKSQRIEILVNKISNETSHRMYKFRHLATLSAGTRFDFFTKLSNEVTWDMVLSDSGRPLSLVITLCCRIGIVGRKIIANMKQNCQQQLFKTIPLLIAINGVISGNRNPIKNIIFESADYMRLFVEISRLELSYLVLMVDLLNPVIVLISMVILTLYYTKLMKLCFIFCNIF